MSFLQIIILSLASVNAIKCPAKTSSSPSPEPTQSGNSGGLSNVQSTCDSNFVGKGNATHTGLLSSSVSFQLQEDPNGTSEYFSKCAYTPDAGDLTPSQRNVPVKTDCLPSPLTVADINLTGKPFINLFCSAIAEKNSTFYDQVPRSTLLAKPPKCDPTYPNSPGSREFFMRMANTWRDISGLGHLQFNECLAKQSNRPTEGHDGFGDDAGCDAQCTGPLLESAFGAAGEWNWWRRISIPMCSLLGDAHRASFIDPKITKIGYYYTLKDTKDGYYLHVQSC